MGQTDSEYLLRPLLDHRETNAVTAPYIFQTDYDSLNITFSTFEWMSNPKLYILTFNHIFLLFLNKCK